MQKPSLESTRELRHDNCGRFSAVATYRELDKNQKPLTEFNRLRKEAIKLATDLDLRAKRGDLDKQAAWATGEVSRRLRQNASLNPSEKDISSEADETDMLGPELGAAISYSDAVGIIDGLKVVRGRIFNIKFIDSQSGFDSDSMRIPID